MGGFVSHPADVETACPGSEERVNTYHFFDPRSPSVEISRTPIMVAEPVSRILDPRSPSEGIERTPINCQLPEKFRKPCLTEISNKIPPLCFDVDMEDSKTEETDESFLSFIEGIDSSYENENDSSLVESAKILPAEKVEKATEEIMPSPILPLVPNGHIMDTPDILTSTRIPVTTAATITSTSTKLPDSLISKSKIPTCQVTKKVPAPPTMMSLANSKKRSDIQPGKGFGWKKSVGSNVFTGRTDSEGRSPLLNRNGDNLSFSPLQANALCKVQPSYRQNPMRGRGKDIEKNVLRADVHNKENVTILWEN